MKLVVTSSYTSVTWSVVHKFIKRRIICQYRLPRRIILDNVTNLKNKMIEEVRVQFKIKHHNSTPFRPKMNGVVEAANKNIKRIIEEMMHTYKDWHEKLSFALHAYRTTVRTFMRANMIHNCIYFAHFYLSFCIVLSSFCVFWCVFYSIGDDQAWKIKEGTKKEENSWKWVENKSCRSMVLSSCGMRSIPYKNPKATCRDMLSLCRGMPRSV